MDAQQRTGEVTGQIRISKSTSRSRREQANAGSPDRLPKDDGGHYIAARFGGPAAAFNHFAQDRNFNRGAYRELERKWGIDIAKGHTVLVRIVPHYVGTSVRPDRLDVYWTVDGKPYKRDFGNGPGGK